jgi:hypothetical protein
MGYNNVRNIVPRKTLQNVHVLYISVNKCVKDTRMIGILDLTSERLKYVTIILYSAKGSSLWQLYFTQLKAQACDNYILLS